MKTQPGELWLLCGNTDQWKLDFLVSNTIMFNEAHVLKLGGSTGTSSLEIQIPVGYYGALHAHVPVVHLAVFLANVSVS